MLDESGRELAKGIVNYSRSELEQVKGLRSAEVGRVLPQASSEAIHRDYLVLLG